MYIDAIAVIPKGIISMAENIMLERVGASTQLCLTPFVTRIGSADSPSSCMWTCIPSWNEQTKAMNLSGQPKFANIFHKHSLLTVSKAFGKVEKSCVKVAMLLLAFPLELK